MVFALYTQSSPPLDDFDKCLGCVCLYWVTDDEVDHFIRREDSYTTETNALTVAKWYGLEPL